jgi:putative membrane protein insertion efficiency factor
MFLVSALLIFGQPHETNPLAIVTDLSFELYQTVISPCQGDVCNFVPSCSNYARTAIKRYGIVWGMLMAGDRLMRCNPWAYQQYGTHYRKIIHYKLSDPVDNNYIFNKTRFPAIPDELRRIQIKISRSSTHLPRTYMSQQPPTHCSALSIARRPRTTTP